MSSLPIPMRSCRRRPSGISSTNFGSVTNTASWPFRLSRPLFDVRATIPVIDSLVFVVEWGNTRIKTVERHLMAEPELHDRLLGVVLNKADLKVLEKFERQGLYQDQ